MAVIRRSALFTVALDKESKVRLPAALVGTLVKCRFTASTGSASWATFGIHHITLITRKVQATVDFCVGFLGLRLVKQTAYYEDATQLRTCSTAMKRWCPGSLITFSTEDGAGAWPRPADDLLIKLSGASALLTWRFSPP